MATEAQIKANQTNSQKSTGPKTADGKAKSAANSTSHGLMASPRSIFENNPSERTRFEALKEKLHKQIQPTGELEFQAFESYCFAAFQASRARRLEAEAQDRWSNEPSNELWFNQMERLIKLGATQERRAAKALRELRQLQKDRFSSMDVHNEMYLLGQKADIPATLPVAEMRKARTSNGSAIAIATMLLTSTPEIQQILRNPTNPPHDSPASTSPASPSPHHSPAPQTPSPLQP